MDIYTLLAKIRKARRKHMLSAGCQALFYELMAINNEERWSGVFRCPNGELCSALTITEKTLDIYRKELLAADLIGFRSGKSKRIPCEYSLNGSIIGNTFDSSNGITIGGKNYAQSDNRSVEKTPNLLIQKSNIESNIIDDEDDVNAQARKNEIEAAISDYDQISNASFEPAKAHLPVKEKNSAKKEKVLPTLDEAVTAIGESAFWRHVLEHHKQNEDERHALFKIFYEQREDNYKIRLPTWKDVAQHFYNWVPIHLSKDKLLLRNGNAIKNSSTNTNGNTKPAVSTKDKRAELLNINQQSTEFLRRIDH